MKTLKVIPAIPGYGERVIVEKNDTKVVDFFHLICLWICNSDDNTIIFELPLHCSIKDRNNAMIQLALERLGVKGEDI